MSPSMPEKQSFRQILREQVVAQANLLEALTRHPALVGTGRERAVMDMLRGQLPRRYEVLSGTVLGQDDDGIGQKEDRQLDVMVVDTFDYPALLRNGDIAVVLPQAVRVVIEVKSDLVSPPDPDKPVETENPESTDEGTSKKRQSPKKKETFLEAIRQVARSRSLFDMAPDRTDGASDGDLSVPVLTILLSYNSPTKNDTLRRWLDLVVKTRQNLGEEMLDASLFPDIIIADKGALAVRTGSKYDFFIAEGDDKRVAPGLVTLVSHVVDHLERQDPVLDLMRNDEKYSPLRRLRQKANSLFGTVMGAHLRQDTDNAALDLTEPRQEMKTEDRLSDLVGDGMKGAN